MHYNGPAIWGGCVTRRKHRAGSRYPASGGTSKLSRCKPCLPAGREGMAHFLPSGYKFHWALRVSRLPRASATSDGGTSLIGAANLSPVAKLREGTGAVSRYKLSRSQKFVKVQDLNCVQMSVSGCKNHYKFV
jgi:hypothetical protein